MPKQIFLSISIIFILASCSSLKPLSFTANRPANTNMSGSTTAKTKESDKKGVKFIDDISVSSSNQKTEKGPQANEVYVISKSASKETPAQINPESVGLRKNSLESASALQMKYSILLNTEVENINNPELYKKIDDWYGTRYCLGGTTSKCIDCSAFMQVLFSSLYGFTLPRTARDQYKLSTKISRTEMKEGDLLFFNTRGGVSHVGFYLQNNKFVHASTGGVTISDIFDPYYLKRFIGVGRIENKGLVKK